MDEDQILESIIADPNVVDPSIDVAKLRQATQTDPRVLADVPEFSGLEYDPTQQSYIEDLYALYSGALPTIEPPAVVTPTIDTTPTVDTVGTDQVASDSALDSVPTGDLIQSGTFADQPTFTTTPGTTVNNITGDITNPDGSYGGNIVDEVALTGLVDPREQASVSQYDTAPKDLSEEMSEGSLTGQQQNSLSSLAGISDTIADFGKNVQDTLGGVFDAANNTVEVFGQKFNVAKTATGLALNAAFGAPVSLAFSLADQLSEAIPQSSQTVADVLSSTYGVDDQGRVQGNPADNVFAGMNAVSMFGDPIQAAQERIDNVVDPAKKAAFQTQLNEVVNKSFVTEDELIDDPVTTQELKQELKQEANVEKDMPTEEPISIDRPTIAEITDGLGRDDSPTGPPEGPGITADDAFESDGPSNVGGPPSVDDFDDGTMTGKAADVTGDPISGFFDAVDEAAGGGASTGSVSQEQSTANRDVAMGGGNTGSTGVSDAQAAANRDAARGGQGSGDGGNSGKIVCTMMNKSYGFGSFRNKIWLKHSKDLAPEYQIGYHKIFLPLVKISKTNKVIRKMLEHIAVHRTIDIRQESRGKVHLLGRVYRKILEPICYWVGKYVK